MPNPWLRRRVLGSGGWAARAAPLLAVLAVGLLAAPPAGATSASTSGPPFTSATAILGNWINATHPRCDFPSVPSSPHANRVSGRATMGLESRTIQCGTTNVAGVAGFEVPFNVSAPGRHTVSAAWTVSWRAEARAWCCFAYYINSFALVRATLVLRIVDLTNGSVFFGPGSVREFVDLPAYTGLANYSNGSVALTIHLAATLVASHTYAVVTFVRAFTATHSVEIQKNPGVTLLARFAFAGTNGGQLTGITIR